MGMLGSPQAKAVLAGIAAMVVKRVMQGSSRSVQRMREARRVEHRASMAARIFSR